ncbi:MAG: nicotinate-nucleotide adenylyltransferase [Kiritimatiellia bacterium]
MERIGILGGTFNPVHIGHLLVAQTVRETCGLDRVLLMPCHTPPHKTCDVLASVADRLAMLRLATAGDPGLEVCTLETDRGGVSYAVDTMTDFRAQHPGRKPYFIIGMDSLCELHLWRRVEELLRLTDFVVVDRPGKDRPVSAGELRLPVPWPERLLSGVIRGRLCEVSSREIRMRVAERRTIRYLVTAAVERYILCQGLYAGKIAVEGESH